MIHGQFRRWIVLYKSTLSVPFDGLLTQWQPVMNDVHVRHIFVKQSIQRTGPETIKEPHAGTARFTIASIEV